jgi:superfamily II DNA or RNA helicase
MLEWSQFKEQPEDSGIQVRYATVNPDILKQFWIYWKSKESSLLKNGYSVERDLYSKKWVVKHTIYPKFPETNGPVPLKDISGLKPFQIPIAERLAYIIKTKSSALDASDTGTGKTFIAVAVARELGLKIGVVCPLAVKESWKRVITQHFGLKYAFVSNYESLRSGKYPEIVDTVSGATRYKFDWKCNPKTTLLVFDESHKCKGYDTLNASLMVCAKRAGFKILACSATSAINPLEMRALGYTLDLHNFKDFTKWLVKNGCVRGRFGYEFVGGKPILKQLHKELLLERGVRMTREEIPDFPESDIQAMAYDVGPTNQHSIQDIYSTMKSELHALLQKGKEDKQSDSALTIQLRARQKTELLKVPLFVELAEEGIESGMSVVLFLNFKDSIRAVAEKLKTDCIIWGENTGNERQNNIDKFQSDQSRIILVSVGAGAAGLSLHDLNGKYPRIAYISPSFSAVEIKQVLGRVHRVGGKTKSIQRIVFTVGTVEEQVCDAIKQKLNNLSILNDGDCVPYEKEIFKDS